MIQTSFAGSSGEVGSSIERLLIPWSGQGMWDQNEEGGACLGHLVRCQPFQCVVDHGYAYQGQQHFGLLQGHGPEALQVQHMLLSESCSTDTCSTDAHCRSTALGL